MGTVPYILLLGTALIFALAGVGAMLVLRNVPRAGERPAATRGSPRDAIARAHVAHRPRRALRRPDAPPAAASPEPSRAAARQPNATATATSTAAPKAAPRRLRPADICPTLDDDYDTPTQIFNRDDLPNNGFADTMTLEPGSTPPRFSPGT